MLEKKSLIAFYSLKGSNYLDGNIVNLPIGNTKVAAKVIQDVAGGEIFKIDTLKDYSAD